MSLFAGLLRVVAENVVTDTHTDQVLAITLAAPARRGLTTPTDTTYKPLPILNKLRNTQYRLLPTDTENVDSLDDVLDRYKSCVLKGEDGLLALLWAREAVFGGYSDG